MNVFIEKNIMQALEFISNSKKILNIFFVTNPEALAAKKVQEASDFEFLKTQQPQIQSISRSDILKYKSDTNIYFGWDAYDETTLLKPLKFNFGIQNRLFLEPPCSEIKSFTPFRKYVETLLPDTFETDIYQVSDPALDKELDYYFYTTKLAKKYFEIRNGVVGRDYSTKLSVYLSSGRLNVRFLYNYIKDFEKKHGSNKSTYWIIFELLWREFFYWSYQQHKTKVFSQNGLSSPEVYQRDFDKINWLELFDEDLFMQSIYNELIGTGFISNRLRQLFASSLIYTYKVDWRVGALFFENHLIDYDVYSNWGNWQYIAGVGHDPKGGREFNIRKQLSYYDPDYEHIKKWTTVTDNSAIEMSLSKIYS